MLEAEEQARELAAKLRRAIADAKLSLREVEDRCDMGRDYLSQLLRGTVDLKVKHVFQILAAIELPPDRFFVIAYDRPPQHAEKEEPLSLEEAESAYQDAKALRRRLAEIENRIAQIEAEKRG